MIPLFRCVTAGERPGPAIRAGVDVAIEGRLAMLRSALLRHDGRAEQVARRELDQLLRFRGAKEDVSQ